METKEIRRIEESLFQIELELKKIKALTETVHNEFFGRANPEEVFPQFSKYQLYSSMILYHLVCVQGLLDEVPCPGWNERKETQALQR